MLIATLLQLFAACAGVVGSLFFAIGVMRQSVDEMSKLASTYFGWNPHMINAVAAQKADYLFGGCIIVCAFGLQLVSFLVPQSTMALSVGHAQFVPWIALLVTVLTFLGLRYVSKSVASRFAHQIRQRLGVPVDRAPRADIRTEPLA